MNPAYQTDYSTVFFTIFAFVLFTALLVWVCEGGGSEIDHIVDLIMKKYRSYRPISRSMEALRRGIRPTRNLQKVDKFKGYFSVWNNLDVIQRELRFPEDSERPCPVAIRKINYDKFVEKLFKHAEIFRDWSFIYCHARSQKHCKIALKNACSLARTRSEIEALAVAIVKFAGDRFEDPDMRVNCGARVQRDLYYLVHAHKEMFDTIFREDLHIFRKGQERVLGEYLARGNSHIVW